MFDRSIIQARRAAAKNDVVGLSDDSPAHMERIRGMNKKTEELEEIIGYHFKNKHYLIQALTHSSYANEKKLGKLGSNERLEFLGDAVLELISSDYLYARFTQLEFLVPSICFASNPALPSVSSTLSTIA